MQHHIFHLGLNVTNLWLERFNSASISEFMVIIAAVSGVTFAKTIVAAFEAHPRLSPANQQKYPKCRRITVHFFKTFLLLLNCLLGYLLMLAFMILNVWICLTIVGSSVISYFFLFWMRITPKERIPFKFIPRQNSAKNATMLRDSIFTRPYSAATAVDRGPLLSEMTVFLPSREDNPLEDDNHHMNAGDMARQPDLSPSMEEKPDVVPDLMVNTSVDNTNDDPPEGTPGDRRSSLFEKYPVLRFHNVDIKDSEETEPDQPLLFDELDDIVRQLQEQ